MRLVIALCLIVPVAAVAAEKTCKRSTALTGQCRMVKGSLGLTQGVGVTVIGDDGSRTLIKAPADSNADIAPKVMQNWLFWQSKTGSMKTRILGTFELCPLPPSVNAAGITQFACINNAARITQDKASPN